MYQLDPQAPHYEMIGDKGQQQPYDETYLQTIANLKLKFSDETKQIQQQFNDDGIISFKDWNNYDWILLCIAYCLTKNNNINDWEQNPDNKVMEMSVETLFQKQTPFWVAFISEQMFQSNLNKDNWTTGEFANWVRIYAHNGALALKKRWEKLLVAFETQPYKARSAFLTELVEIATENMPKQTNVIASEHSERGNLIANSSDNNLSGSLKPDTTVGWASLPTNNLKEILEKCKIPAESVVLSSNGVRYDIYEIKFFGVTELDKKTDDIAAYLGISENSVIAGGQVIGKPLTQYLKILRHQNEWRSFGETEFQAALQQYQGNDELPVCIGLEQTGKPVFKDFHEAPHAIIGGTTGSGKSVAVKVILQSLLQLTPQENLQVIILDPKKVDYQQIAGQYPHIDLITENDKMLAKIEQLTEEMDERYSILASRKVGKISDIPASQRPFSFTVVIIDEVADLLMTNPEIAEPLTRLSQKARAVGIHLLLSTQRPEVKILGEKTGAVLRSNLLTKIAFKVDKEANSKIILDEEGAEKLIGKGDHWVKWNGGEKLFLHGYNI